MFPMLEYIFQCVLKRLELYSPLYSLVSEVRLLLIWVILWIKREFCQGHVRQQAGPALVCADDFSSVQFIRSVVSDSLGPHESKHARPPCLSPTPRVYSSPCPSSRWCHPAISSSVVPFSSCPQSLPASGSFPMSQLFTWGGQSIGVSASALVLPMNTQD